MTNNEEQLKASLEEKTKEIEKLNQRIKELRPCYGGGISPEPTTRSFLAPVGQLARAVHINTRITQHTIRNTQNVLLNMPATLEKLVN